MLIQQKLVIISRDLHVEGGVTAFASSTYAENVFFEYTEVCPWPHPDSSHMILLHLHIL